VIRFCFKLVVLVVMAFIVQRYVIEDARNSDIWFGLRCDYANLMQDAPLLEQLLVEARDKRAAEWEHLSRRVNAGPG